ncbi:MAG: RNA polymerase sigma factor [bacterium]
MNTTNPELLRQIKILKDQESWVSFVHIYYESVVRWIREFSGSTQNNSLEDLAQEVFLVIFQKIEHFERERKGSLRRWIKSIVRNVVFQKYHTDQKNSLTAYESAIDIPDTRTVEDRPNDRLDLIEQAIKYVKKDFTAKSWQAFEMVYHKGLTPREAAAELEITENTVYIATSRIPARIRSVLHQFVDEP